MGLEYPEGERVETIGASALSVGDAVILISAEDGCETVRLFNVILTSDAHVYGEMSEVAVTDAGSKELYSDFARIPRDSSLMAGELTFDRTGLADYLSLQPYDWDYETFLVSSIRLYKQSAASDLEVA